MCGIDACEVAGHGIGAAECEAGEVIEKTTTDDVDIYLARDLS